MVRGALSPYPTERCCLYTPPAVHLHRRGLVKRKVARNRHKLVFYKDLFLWMLPWLVTAAIATADGATCFDSYKRTCSYKKKVSMGAPQAPHLTLTSSADPPLTLAPSHPPADLPIHLHVPLAATHGPNCAAGA